jgi:hypothetical protein
LPCIICPFNFFLYKLRFLIRETKANRTGNKVIDVIRGSIFEYHFLGREKIKDEEV